MALSVPYFPDSLEDAIEHEREFFAGATKRLQSTSEELKLQWRRETVFERRTRISGEVFDLLDGTVAYGPFSGMSMVDSRWRGMPDFGSMLLGLYEAEVVALIEDLCKKSRSYFIDIGAAEGYYPIGVLVGGLVEKAYAFESDERGRDTIAKNAERNKVGNSLIIHGQASLDSLSTAIEENGNQQAVILCDIAGGEFELFNRQVLRRLSDHHLIIEIHNWVDSFEVKYRELLANASNFFRLGFIPARDRQISHLAELDEFTDDNRLLLMSEGRPNRMRYLFLEPLPVEAKVSNGF